MLRNLLSKVTLKGILNSPSLIPDALSLSYSKDIELASQIYTKIVQAHRESLQKHQVQSDKLVDFLCACHFQQEADFDTGRFDDLSWIFTRTSSKIFISNAWQDAIQQELNISFFPKLLLELVPFQPILQRMADLTHYIHTASYNFIKYKNLTPTYALIYRNAVQFSQPLQLQGTLTIKPYIEYQKADVDGYANVRCCSIKPHACENYDLGLKKNVRFVLARGMVERQYNTFECVMPTVLFTNYEKDVRRFKSTTGQQSEVLVIGGKSLEDFFYLYSL